MNAAQVSRKALLVAAAQVLLLITPTIMLAGEVTAVSAREFLDSIGICTHIGQGVDDPHKSADALAYAGVRNIRDDASPRHVQDWIDVHKQTGIRVVLTQSGPTDTAIPRILRMSKQLAKAGALLALEGPNEPNNWAVTWHGQKSSSKTTFMPVAQWQAAFYAAAKADPALKDYPVFASSEAGGSEPDNVGLQFLTIPDGAGTHLPVGTRFGDYANVHNYICRKPAIIDNMAWLNADPTFHGWTDGIYVEYGKTWHKGFAGYSDAELAKLPRVTTETGWVTGGPKGLTQEQQARLYLNLYLAQFKRGFRYTFIYMLRDGGGGDDAGYGIFLQNYQPKRSAAYLHNLTSILDDARKGTAGSFSYSIPNPPSTVHDLLLRKGGGTFELVLWDERAKGSDTITVGIEGALSSIKVYDPTEGVSPIQQLSHARQVPLMLTDHPVILEIERGQ